MSDTTSYAARREFRAMGTDCLVIVYGGDIYGGDAGVERLADLARQRVEILEGLWSRFRADSELSRLNDRSGRGSVAVSAETERLLRAMRSGWEATNGAFDPTVLTAVRAAGYDRDFAAIVATDSIAAVLAEAPGMAEISIGERCVSLPAGVGVDPGAIGKGLAADIIADEMVGAGAQGALVDLGGDIAFAGYPGEASSWRIAMRDERSREAFGWHEVPAGIAHAGIATSTSLTRRLAQGRHHVIDPATGTSTDEEIVQTTVSGARAWECEVWATATLVRPTLHDKLPEGMSCLAFANDHTFRNDFRNADQEQVA